MAFYDQHMHTLFSPDSNETFENYLKQTDGILVTTEHLDFRDRYNGSRDTILDYEAYSKKIAELNKEHNNRIRKGIEIGFTPDSYKRIQTYLNGKTFDVKLLSVHQNDRFDFLEPVVDNIDPKTIMDEYYQLCLTAVQTVEEANVFAHFDYGIRRLGGKVSVDDFKAYEAIVSTILSEVIKKDMALELNTRSMYQYGNVDIYKYVIQLYKSIGGKNFSLGSDAHSIEKYRYHFDDAIAILKANGFNQVMQFKDGKGYFEEI